MRLVRSRFRWLSLVICSLLWVLPFAAVSVAATLNSYGVSSDNPYLVNRFVHDGKSIDEVIVPGRPPVIQRMLAVEIPEPDAAAGINTLTYVPAFDWSYGSFATAAAMLFGYYDNTGYPNIYTGPTNGGVVPMTNAVWGTGKCPLSATKEGLDGRTGRGHVDDYWIAYGSAATDPFIGNWTEHAQGECTGDFMGTNQSLKANADGMTTIYFNSDGTPLHDYTGKEPAKRDGCHGMRLFFESRGYTAAANYSQYIMGYNGNTQGFTFADYKAEIDAGRPVILQVDGHSMLGYGYNDSGTLVYFRDAWDHDAHAMTWGGSYNSLRHYGVTVFVPAVCRYDISPVTATVPAMSGSGEVGVNVATGSGCAWTAVSNDPDWITVTSGGSGSGTGTVVYSYTANPGRSARTGTIAIAGNLFTLTQKKRADLPWLMLLLE